MRLGSYEILLCIGRGGMASVWAARQHGARGFSRLVALKTILPDLAAPDLDGMFLDEARVTARIHHPNVCEVFELIEHGGVLALSMEWVDGDTLHNVIQSVIPNVIQNRPKDPALDPRVAAQIIAQVAYGLHAAHELRDERGAPLQLIHRDVSPQNILISRTGHVKVTDFGVAKSLGGVREATAFGKVKGKLSYMSPEQAQGEPIDRRSDIFSLGVVLYLATVGSHPFRRPGESRHQQLLRLLTNRLKRPSHVVKGYPAQLEAIVLRALDSHPARRFVSADEMARALQDWMLSSGPLVTDQQIAQMMLERAGATILERSERIANLMCAAPEAPAASEQAQDPTLVPTTSRTGHSSAPGRALDRISLGTVSTTLTAGAIALAASFVFTTPTAPSSALAGQGAELMPAAPATVTPAAPAAAEPLGDSARHATLTAPSTAAGVEPGATARRSAVTRSTAAARARPRARKPSGASQKRASRQNDPLAIKRGR